MSDLSECWWSRSFPKERGRVERPLGSLIVVLGVLRRSCRLGVEIHECAGSGVFHDDHDSQQVRSATFALSRAPDGSPTSSVEAPWVPRQLTGMTGRIGLRPAQPEPLTLRAALAPRATVMGGRASGWCGQTLQPAAAS